jgi:hypothetical protein
LSKYFKFPRQFIWLKDFTNHYIDSRSQAFSPYDGMAETEIDVDTAKTEMDVCTAETEMDSLSGRVVVKVV